MDETLPLPLYTDHWHASAYLAEGLRVSALSLMLGAGASTGMGLPSWRRLVLRIAFMAEVDYRPLLGAERPSVDTLLSVAGNVQRKVEKGDVPDWSSFEDLVQSALYRRFVLGPSTLQNELLIALGMLLMGSSRGSIQSVLNFNYDDVLEWYLRMHGYTVQVVSEHPTLIRRADAVVYHVQGYLPSDQSQGTPSKAIVMSRRDAVGKTSDPENRWQLLLRSTVESSIPLVVGLSPESLLTDNVLREPFASAHKTLDGARPTAFWLIGRELSEDAREEMLEDLGIVPVVFGDYEEIPIFLLKICQLAAGGSVDLS